MGCEVFNYDICPLDVIFRYFINNLEKQTEMLIIFYYFCTFYLKVAFIQKVLMHLSFPQTDEPYYFPELEL